jgi:glycosyltransferase involved in cell wall biosynthesis
MKISFNTPISAGKIRNNDGYGYGTERILASLRNLGYEVTENDASADVGFVFNQPHHAKYYGNQYRIILHPWESTLLMPDWPGIMNDCDEVWSPSPLIGAWYQEYNGIVKPIYTYEHGIDSVWEVRPRPVKDTIKFLHVGGEAYRKGMPETLKAFRAAFPDPAKAGVEITYKIGVAGFNLDHHRGTNTISGKMPFNELLDLHYQHNIFVYPSWGEGFGFNPFQAMATGMPTIVTGAWAPYERFIDPELNVKTHFAPSPWPRVHPGEMFQPDFDDLVDKMRWAVENYDSVHTTAQAVAPLIHKEYAWDTVTKSTFEALEKRLESR